MIADRYARALFHLAKDPKKWLEELELLTALFDSKRMHYFVSPLTGWQQKERVLNTTFGSHLDPLLLNFLRILLKKKRFIYLPEIVELYKAKVYEKLGIIEGLLITPSSTSEEMKKNLADKWGMLLDKKIMMREEIEKELIGGGIFLFQDKRIDFSLRGKLDRLQKSMRAS